MQIIQISDLHISTSTDANERIAQLHKLHNYIATSIPKDENIMFCICGDITNKGNSEGFSHAERFLTEIGSTFKNNNISIIITPGNHDITNNSTKTFEKYLKAWNSKKITLNEHPDGFVINHHEHFICGINTPAHGDHKFGKLDENHNKYLSELPNERIILIMHHHIFSNDCEDASCLRNAASIIKTARDKKITCILHGHTHGYCDITLNDHCKIIGVGPFFNSVDGGSQFNSIRIAGGIVISISNHHYRKDIDKYTTITPYSLHKHPYFSSDSFAETHAAIVNITKDIGPIYGLDIIIKNTIKNLTEEMTTQHTQSMEYAKEWCLSREDKENFYYNHHSKMNINDEDGIEYIIKELKNKGTSSRALIPIIRHSDLSKNNDGYIPSLNILQFGIDETSRDTLLITMYFRALEIGNFLKINTCEACIIANTISDHIPELQNIHLNIKAFRAQYIDGFSCFKKCIIDTLGEDHIEKLINSDPKTLANHIREKSQVTETVIFDDGIKKLKNVIEKQSDSQFRTATIAIIEQMNELTASLRTRKQNYSIHAKPHEIEQLLRTTLLKLSDAISNIGRNQ